MGLSLGVRVSFNYGNYTGPDISNSNWLSHDENASQSCVIVCSVQSFTALGDMKTRVLGVVHGPKGYRQGFFSVQFYTKVQF